VAFYLPFFGYSFAILWLFFCHSLAQYIFGAIYLRNNMYNNMSGGIFPGYPFTLNVKCIIFSLLMMALYSFCPPRSLSFAVNAFIYFMIFVVSYVALAWYDYYYGCKQLPLMRGKYSFTGLFKPPPHVAVKQVEHMMSETDVMKNHTMIYILHLLVIVPLLGYVGLRGARSDSRVYLLLLALAAFTAVYHGSKLMLASH